MAGKINPDRDVFIGFESQLEAPNSRRVVELANSLFTKMSTEGLDKSFAFRDIGVRGSLFYRIALWSLVEIRRTQDTDSLERDVAASKALFLWCCRMRQGVEPTEQRLVDSRLVSLWVSLVERVDSRSEKIELWNVFLEGYGGQLPLPALNTLKNSLFFPPKERASLLMALVRSERYDLTSELLEGWGPSALTVAKELIGYQCLFLDQLFKLLPGLDEEEQKHLLVTFCIDRIENRDLGTVHQLLDRYDVSQLPKARGLAWKYCQMWPERFYAVSHKFLPECLPLDPEGEASPRVSLVTSLPGICAGLAFQRHGKKEPVKEHGEMQQLRYMLQRKLSGHQLIDISNIKVPETERKVLDERFAGEDTSHRERAIKLFYLNKLPQEKVDELAEKHPSTFVEKSKLYGVERVDTVLKGDVSDCVREVFSCYTEGEYHLSLHRPKAGHRVYLSMDEYVLGDNMSTLVKGSLAEIKKYFAWKVGTQFKKRGYMTYSLRRITRTPFAYLKHQLETAEGPITYNQALHDTCFLVNKQAGSDVIGRAFLEYNRRTGDGINPHVKVVESPKMISDPMLLLSCLK